MSEETAVFSHEYTKLKKVHILRHNLIGSRGRIETQNLMSLRHPLCPLNYGDSVGKPVIYFSLERSLRPVLGFFHCGNNLFSLAIIPIG